jgi:hypothetical protein
MSTERRRPRVFISATAEDLGPYCRRVDDAIRMLDMEPIYHPKWGATGRPSLTSKCA